MGNKYSPEFSLAFSGIEQVGIGQTVKFTLSREHDGKWFKVCEVPLTVNVNWKTPDDIVEAAAADMIRALDDSRGFMLRLMNEISGKRKTASETPGAD